VPSSARSPTRWTAASAVDSGRHERTEVPGSAGPRGFATRSPRRRFPQAGHGLSPICLRSENPCPDGNSSRRKGPATRGSALAFSRNKRKILENAQKYVQKGSYDKALKEYASLLKADPKDTNVRLKIGDLHLKRGDPGKALEAYGQVATIFSNEGFDAKAVAIYKQMLRIDAASLDARIKLGELYQRLGLASDALREFQEGVKLCRDRGQKREAFELLKRVASLDPTNVQNRLSLADLMARDGMESEAREEYESLLREVERSGDDETRLRVCEHTLDAFPHYALALQGYAAACRALGREADGIERLRRALPDLPDNLDVRETLADLLESSGESDRAGGVYREIAELYKRRGDEEKARDIMQRHVPVEAFADDDDTSPSIELDQLLGGGAPTSAAAEAVSAQKTSARKKPSKGSPEELIDEARVSLEYGNFEEAEARAREVIAAQKDNEAARGLLAEALFKQSKFAEALKLQEQRAGLALAGGDAERAAEIEQSIRQIRAAMPQGAAPGAAAAPEPDEPSPADELPDVELVLEDEEAPTGEVDIELGAADAPAVEEPAEEPVSEQPAAEKAPGGSASWADSTQIAERLEEAEFYVEQKMFDEAEAVLRAVLENAPNHPQAMLRLGEIGKLRGETPEEAAKPEGANNLQDTMVQDEEDDSFPSLPELEIDAGKAEATPEPAEEEPATTVQDPGLDLGDALRAEIGEEEASAEEEEAAIEIDEEISIEIDEPEPAPEPVPEPAPIAAEEEAGDFDLAAELEGGAVSSEEASIDEGFEQVFRAFKRGIQEQLGEEECDAHYDLAIAYREMGLLDDAVQELEIVARGGRALEANVMMAECKVGLGRPDEAVVHLRDALKLPDAQGSAAVPVHYELGVALLAADKRKEALVQFKKAAAGDPNFREVREKIAELEGSG
jgi:tetratricopeptide (TPR) repeat protein